MLEHILHHYNTYPCPYGAEQTGSLIQDAVALDNPNISNEKHLFLSHNNSTLISVSELPNNEYPQSTRSRIVTRDNTGKYVWDNYIFYESIQKCKNMVNGVMGDDSRTAGMVGMVDDFILGGNIKIEDKPRTPTPYT